MEKGLESSPKAWGLSGRRRQKEEAPKGSPGGAPRRGFRYPTSEARRSLRSKPEAQLRSRIAPQGYTGLNSLLVYSTFRPLSKRGKKIGLRPFFLGMGSLRGNRFFFIAAKGF